MATQLARESLVVVRDRSLAALADPGPAALRSFGAVTYVHHSDASSLPDVPWYIFNLDHLDERSYAQATAAVSRGARVVLVLRHVDPSMVSPLLASTMHVLPSHGVAEHIGEVTFRRALRVAVQDRRSIAAGFLEHSKPARPGDGVRTPFLRLLRQMSDEALDGTSVVAAVLAQRRTGSQFLRDLLGWTTGAGVRIFHEHEMPASGEKWPEGRGISDVLAEEPDPARHKPLRRAALRHQVVTARRKYIFVPDREPRSRVVSVFMKRNSYWLRERLDESTGTFRNADIVQRRFDEWLPEAVRRQAQWHRRWLLDTFGLDVCRTEPTEDGLLVARRDDNMLIVVPIERLNGLRDAVEARYGPGSCDAIDQDSAHRRGDATVAQAFRRDIKVPDAVAEILRSSPEQAHIREHVYSSARSLV